MMEVGLGRYWGVGGRRCEACGGSPAAVHCRTCEGRAYLCVGCDAGHARAGHERVWVCEVCERAPAAVTCRADAAALCAACDADIHDANPLARRHERVPVLPIGAAPATVDALLFGAAAGDDGHVFGGKDDAAAGMLVGAVGAKEAKLDFLFADVMDPFLGPELARFPHADSVVPNNGSSGGAVELDFGGAAAAVAPKPSYSSYTAASHGHSVRLLVGGRPGAGRDLRPRRERDRRRHRARLRAVQSGLPAVRRNSCPQRVVYGCGGGAGAQRRRHGRQGRDAGDRGEPGGAADAVPREAEEPAVREDDPVRVPEGLRRDAAARQGPLRQARRRQRRRRCRHHQRRRGAAAAAAAAAAALPLLRARLRRLRRRRAHLLIRSTPASLPVSCRVVRLLHCMPCFLAGRLIDSAGVTHTRS